jgi:hypothetical protein
LVTPPRLSTANTNNDGVMKQAVKVWQELERMRDAWFWILDA